MLKRWLVAMCFSLVTPCGKERNTGTNQQKPQIYTSNVSNRSIHFQLIFISWRKYRLEAMDVLIHEMVKMSNSNLLVSFIKDHSRPSISRLAGTCQARPQKKGAHRQPLKSRTETSHKLLEGSDQLELSLVLQHSVDKHSFDQRWRFIKDIVFTFQTDSLAWLWWDWEINRLVIR